MVQRSSTHACIVLCRIGSVQIQVWFVGRQYDSFTDMAMHFSCFMSVLVHRTEEHIPYRTCGHNLLYSSWAHRVGDSERDRRRR